VTRCFGWMLLSVSLVGCASDNTLFRQTQLDTFEQVPNDEVDILFVVDDSNSMQEEQEALAEGFVGFMSQLEDANSKFHLGVVSTSADDGAPGAGRLLGNPAVLDVRDDYLSLFRQRVQVGTEGSDKEKGLWAAELALSPELLAGPNAGFLRPEANLLVTFVTDEEDCSDDGALDGMESAACYGQPDLLTPIDQTRDALVAAKGGNADLVRIGAIVGPTGDERCQTAYPGARYARLAVETGGMIGDICAGDWSDMLYALGLEAVGVRTSFELTYEPVPGTVLVRVDDVEVPEDGGDGYSYGGRMVTFHGDAVPERGAVVTVEYEMLSGG
jgi:hypothetical protein